MAAADEDLRELPRVGRVRVHVPCEDANVLFLVAADQTVGMRDVLPAPAATLAEAEAITTAAGHDMPRSVTRALCALTPIRRAQWLGLLRAVGHDLVVAPVLDPGTGLPPTEQTCYATRRSPTTCQSGSSRSCCGSRRRKASRR